MARQGRVGRADISELLSSLLFAFPIDPCVQGPATLPLDILLNIAAFVAGDNNYGTLLNFCLVSKCIKEDMKPIFYETRVFTGPQDVLLENGTDMFSDAYGLTRYVANSD